MKIPVFTFLLMLLVVPAVFGQKSSGEFSLHLISISRKPGQMPKVDLNKLKKPKTAPLIAAKDIQYYNKDRHDIGLWYSAGKRINDAARDLRGKPFAIFVGNEAVYVGAFWSTILSQSFDGTWIDLHGINPNNPILELRFGYPGEDFATGSDPRDDARIANAFAEYGNLQQELIVRGKCTGMRNTMKRRASVIFTFTVDSVIKGDHKEREIEFETYSDGEGGKLLRALRSNGTPYGDKWTFDKDKQITLKFDQETGPKAPEGKFWFISAEAN